MTDQLLPLLEIPMWELVSDGIQIFLCLMIFLFLLWNRIKYKRWFLNAVSKEKRVVFSDEIRMQQLKQLAEQSFDNIADTIHQERLTLQDHFEAGFVDSEQHVSVLQTPEDFKNVIQDDEKSADDTELGSFSEIVSLADKGLSVREISKRLNMPGGEVELVLRLNKDVVEDKPGNNLRARA
ncbi:MAG: hypothetical protein JRF72_08460 [Deltaproteobacteria bacterium]|jgi:hypothetical protein|nr:hypothetical protein [Deltaproteobacteria bacterium]